MISKLKYFFTLLFLLSTLKLIAQITEVKYLSGEDNVNTVDWDFQCTAGRNSGRWTKIAVPSNWELQGFGNYTYGSEKEDRGEAGLYKYAFTVPSHWKNKTVYLVFDGAMTDTEVKINGKLAGPIHQGAFYQFKYNIKALLNNNGTNILEVKVNKVSSNQTINEAERSADFWVFGGIFRPVFLEAFPHQHIQRVAIDAKADGSLKVNAYVANLQSITAITAQVKTLNGKPFGKPFSVNLTPGTTVAQLNTKLINPELWSSEFPNRYKIDITIKNGTTKLHTVTETIGFRTVELRQHDGFYVNGQKIKFKGVNHGSFWPTSGRTTSRKISILDAELIKEMNMNAVRMSHYPPDKHFLEVCDSIGLYVIDELTGWQYPPYDTQVGQKLVKEMIVRDVNHPSIIMWANGNEGGFNFDLLPDYPKHDIQNRPVIQPWMNINGMNTKHYIPWNYGNRTFFQGNDVFFPTEFLHGLYDGGHGAGLDDFWNLMQSNPLSAGGFLWDFCDQGVMRTDMGGRLDTKGNAASDGILGPYREKEASFFTIKEIWSPVYFPQKFISKLFNGKFDIENRYNFTNLNKCSFSWKLKKITGFDKSEGNELTGKITSPDIKPQSSGILNLALPAQWAKYDVLYITARDLYGKELYTWSWPITSPQQFADRMIENGKDKINVTEDNESLRLSCSGVEVKLSKETGLMVAIRNKKGEISFSNGPVLINGEANFKSFKHSRDSLGRYVVVATYEGKQNFKVTWTMMPSGWLGLKYQYRANIGQEILGVSFNYPEEKINGMQLIGNGPYRVYKNRLKGGTLNLWDKKYNNAVTGETWDYPEFKGYYSNFYGARISTAEGNFVVLSSTDNLFMHMLNPAIPKGLGKANSFAGYPTNGISFLHGIPAIGTKSQKKEDLGPQSQPNLTFANGGLDTQSAVLYFDFR
ncbi:glycoside hydrolase family 2 TIM barrel-domain containing protein [Pedobacter mendelii]|uniref:glycoside hydrolase family 2 protein n=1 Tax=Pedobacter mendelii TaxID=1908240 RepID=UPI003611ABCD